MIYESWPSRWTQEDHIQKLITFFHQHEKGNDETSGIYAHKFNSSYDPNEEMYVYVKGVSEAGDCNCDGLAWHWMKNEAPKGKWKDNENGNGLEPTKMSSNKHNMLQLEAESMSNDAEWIPDWPQPETVQSDLCNRPIRDCVYIAHLSGTNAGWTQACETCMDESDDSEEEGDDSNLSRCRRRSRFPLLSNACLISSFRLAHSAIN